MLISVDPGKKHAAAAVWSSGGLLRGAVYVTGKGAVNTGDSLVEGLESYFPDNYVLEIAIECMQVYTPGKSKGDPNDLIQVAIMVGAFCGFIGAHSPPTIYPPADWKGQAPKGVMQERILEVLSIEERENLGKGLTGHSTKDHNIYDAVGIGLFHLRRIGKFKKVTK